MPLIFVEIKVPFPRDYFWDRKGSDQPEWRPYFPQTPLAPWVATQAENRQQLGAEEFRRVSEDGWSAFRPFWTPPPTGAPFFVGQPAPMRWDYWPQDMAARERTELFRFFMPQTKLTPQVGSQAENRQQMGGEEFRRVSNDGWSDFRPFWQPPAPPPAPPIGNPILWIVGPKGIKTKIAFIGGTEPEKES